MSAPRPCRLLTAGGLSLALALATPGVALADHKQGHDSTHGADQQAPQGEDKGKGDSSSGSSSQRNGGGSSENEGGQAASSEGSAGGSGKSGSAGQPDRSGSGGRAATGNDTGRAAGGDPRGNNGTVKVDGEAFDDGRGNEPHVGCVFSVDFYGFDAGDAATVTLTGQAPTGGGLLHSQHSTISDDAAGGGQDRDATLVFSVQDQLSELLGIAPHPQQGWHVKLAVDVDGAPGGAKQKVFWISCPQAAAASGSETAPAAGGAGQPLTGGTTAGGAEDVSVQKRNIAETPIVRALGEASAEVAGPDAAVAGATLLAARGSAVGDAATSDGAETVAAQGAARPQVLPFTGSQALVGLLALGLTALGVGGAAARLGSRRAAQG